MMSTLDRIISQLEAVFQIIADILIFAIMLVVFADVLLRYLFNSPLLWAYDLISLYMMAGVFFLSLSSTYAAHGHIGMDMLVRKLSPAGRRVSEIITCLTVIPLFAVMTEIGAERAYTHWANEEAISGLIAWPTWIGAAMVPVGAGLLILRLLFRLGGHIASLATGREFVALLPIAGEGVVE